MDEIDAICIRGVRCEPSQLTAAVSPTPELPFPVVYTPLGATDAMYLSSWDLATPGSPGVYKSIAKIME